MYVDRKGLDWYGPNTENGTSLDGGFFISMDELGQKGPFLCYMIYDSIGYLTFPKFPLLAHYVLILLVSFSLISMFFLLINFSFDAAGSGDIPSPLD